MAKKLSRRANQIANEVISLRSRLHTKMIAEQMNLDPDAWLNVPAGNEKLEFEIGQRVVATGEGLYKAGIELVVKDAMLDNGYARYFAGGVWHLSRDLVAFVQK